MSGQSIHLTQIIVIAQVNNPIGIQSLQLSSMGCYESRVVERVEIIDDRDDYDDCCGCGPYYGGPSYREARARWLPGFGSPKYNYFGPGGYAGTIVPGGAAYQATVTQLPPPAVGVIPPAPGFATVPAVEVMPATAFVPPPPLAPAPQIVPAGPPEVIPVGPPVITPSQPGYVSWYNGGPYRPIGTY
jgi:hypothetical protein